MIFLKILICYHSETGNTKVVAESMAEGLESEEVTLLPASDVDPASLASYDAVFLGTGIYAGAIGKSVKELMKKVTGLPPKVAVFCTHNNPDPSSVEKALKGIVKQITECGCENCVNFDCIGENRNEKVIELLMKMPGMAEALENSKGHPDAQDLENAKEFARSVL
jgi:menaquinone-dependent protoporphyrinogen oxidase